VALKRLRNGTFEVKTKAQAVEAFKTSQELSEAVRELEKENGIDEMRMDSTEMHLAATRYMADKKIKALEIPGISKVAKLIQGSRSMWLETKDDLKKQGVPDGARSVRQIVGKEVWKQITKRALDPDKLAEAVATGVVDEDEVNQAYVEIPNAPYVRIYDE
jgi:hypothetical protein